MLGFLKWIGGPGSIGFLALCSAVGLLLTCLGPRGRQIGRLWLLVVFTSYVIAGIPLVANLIAKSVSAYQPVADVSTLKGADVLVVLGGDNVVGRLREARRLFQALGPRLVLVSGPRDFVEAFIREGFPADRVIVERDSSTTREQIIAVRQSLTKRGAGQVVLIASRLQMPRVAALARANGLQIAWAPSAIDDEPPTSGLRLLIPTYIGLRVSRDALYEHLALAYYRHKGWIASS